jgi:tetratricopeptide (TPR) repeat protein
MVVTRPMSNIAYLMQYVNIQIQRHGVTAWQKQFLRFRDRRNFDVCSQLLTLLRTSVIGPDASDLETFYRAEIELLKNNPISADRVFGYLVDNSSSPQIKGMALTRLADVERDSGRFDQAISHYQLALDVYLELQADGDIPYIYHMLGVIHWSREDLEMALDYYQRALNHYRNLSDLDSFSSVQLGNIVLNSQDIQRHISNVLRDIGEVHRRAGRLAIAEEYLQESLNIQEEIGVVFERLLTLLAIGKLNREKGLLEQSMDYYREALQIAPHVETPSLESMILARLSETSYLACSYDQSVEWAIKATDLANTHGFESVLAKAKLFHGLSRYIQGTSFQLEAVKHLRDALIHAGNYSENTLQATSKAIQELVLEQSSVTSSLLELQDLLDSQKSLSHSQETCCVAPKQATASMELDNNGRHSDDGTLF